MPARRSELTDEVATVYATWMRLMTTDVATPCASRCISCRSRAPPQCVLCAGAACCPSEELVEKLVAEPGPRGDLLAMLAEAPALPARVRAMAFGHGSVCILCRYWHVANEK